MIQYTYYFFIITSQTKDEKLPSDKMWLARIPSMVHRPRPTWPGINKSEMTKAKIIWPNNVSLISNQSRKNQMRLISDRFENFLWSSTKKN